MIGLSYKQKCNNFGYHSNEVQSKGNDKVYSGDPKTGHLNTGIIQKLDFITSGSTIQKPTT